MKYLTACLLLLFVLTVHSEEMPIVKMKTNLGTIVLELNPSASPKTVNNFLRYALDGFYEGTIFHRVIKYFIIQGGGYTQDHKKKPPTYAPIPNESNNGLKNLRGTIAMARNAQEHDSATSQFFINVKDNPSLDYGGSIYSDWGYAVFGRVIEGMDVVNKIRKLQTGPSGPFRKYVPRTPVIIEKVVVENAPPLIYDAPVSAEPTAEEEESYSTVLKKSQEAASLPAKSELQAETQAETSLAESETQAKISLAKPEIQSKTLLVEPETQVETPLAEPEIQAKIQSETLLVEPETQVKTPLAEPNLPEPENRAETSLLEPEFQAKASLQKNPEKVVLQTPISSSPKRFLLAPDPPSVSDKQEPLAD